MATHVRHLLVHKMQVQEGLAVPEFDERYAEYCHLKVNVRKVQHDVMSVIRKLRELHAAVAELSETMDDVYAHDHDASSFVSAFHGANQDTQFGFVEHLVEGLKNGVLEPLQTYENELEHLEDDVKVFRDAKFSFEYYHNKMTALQEREQAGDTSVLDRINRNSEKYRSSSEAFHAARDQIVSGLGETLALHVTHLDPAFSRIVDAMGMLHLEGVQSMFRVKQHIPGLQKRCDSVLIAKHGPTGKAYAPDFFFDRCIPRAAMRHMQGSLQMKGRLMMRNVWVVLEGPELQVHCPRDKGEVFQAKDVYRVTSTSEWEDHEDTGICVTTEGRGNLYFLASDEEEASMWMRALISCASWDDGQSRKKVERRIEGNIRFAGHCSAFFSASEGMRYDDGTHRRSSHLYSETARDIASAASAQSAETETVEGTPPRPQGLQRDAAVAGVSTRRNSLGQAAPPIPSPPEEGPQGQTTGRRNSLGQPAPPIPRPPEEAGATARRPRRNSLGQTAPPIPPRPVSSDPLNSSAKVFAPPAPRRQIEVVPTDDSSDLTDLDSSTADLADLSLGPESGAAALAALRPGAAAPAQAPGQGKPRAVEPTPELRREFDRLRGADELLSFQQAMQSEEVHEFSETGALSIGEIRDVWQEIAASPAGALDVAGFAAFVSSLGEHLHMHHYRKEMQVPLDHGFVAL